MGGIGVINGKDVVNKSGYQAYNYGDQYYWNKGVGTGGLLIIFANTSRTRSATTRLSVYSVCSRVAVFLLRLIHT